MAIFVLCRGVLFFAVPFVAVALLCRVFLFHHHTLEWDHIVYLAALGLAVGVIKSASLWRKMERLYGDLQKQSDQVV